MFPTRASTRLLLAATAGGAGILCGMSDRKPSQQQRSTPPANAHHSLKHFKIVVVGGGSAGIGVAGQLAREGETDIAIIEPSETHYYQPLWTLVGGGIYPHTMSAKPTATVIPRGVNWLHKRVESFRPEENMVTMSDGRQVSYDYLVVAGGLQLDWHKVKGLQDSVAKGDVVSIYDYESASRTWEAIKNFTGGRAVFTAPSGAIKCGGAPMKVMFLAEDYFRKQGLRDKVDVVFTTPLKTMFGVEKYSAALEKEREERGIKAFFTTELTEVDAARKVATFQNVEDGSELQVKYDLLHVVPPMSAPDFIKKSPLANKEGFVDVDKWTLQHTKYPNVFSLGDCCSAPTSKTLAAIASQAPVLVHNLLQHSKGRELTAEYRGYSSCPIILNYEKVLLAEFLYDGEISESFAFALDQESPSRAFMFIKKHIFPWTYWNLWVHGYWYGCKLIFKPRFQE